VSEIQDLRRKLRQSNIEYKVTKKNLIKLALAKTKQEIDISGFNGSLALTFSYDDPIAPAKILDNFSKEHETFKILSGIMEDKVLTMEDIKELAKIPSKNELLANLINSIKGPVKGLVNVLGGNIRNLVGVLNAITNK